MQTFASRSFWSVLLIHFPNYVDLHTLKNQLNGLFPLVEYCHVNAVCHKSSIPNDPSINGTNHPQSSLVPNNTYRDAHINMDSAWNISTGGGIRKIKVGVYDEPIYWKHPDFGGPIFSKTVIKGGKDFYHNIDISMVDSIHENHGTMVAGIIGALRNNGIGIAGIAGGNLARGDTGTHLYSMAIFHNDTLTFTSIVANAILRGTISDSFGINIQNHSWSTDEDSAFVLRNAIRNAFINKSVIVGARGNRGNTWKEYPACFQDEWVISVGAAGKDGRFKTKYNIGAIGTVDRLQSSFGAGVDLIAPGGFDNVYTTNSPGFTNFCSGSLAASPYTCFRGTSSAAAHVSGTAALMLSLHNTSTGRGYPNDLAPDDVEHILSKYATDVEDIADVDVYDANQVLQRTETILFDRGYDEYNGWGLLNAGASLRMINMPKYHISHPTVNGTLSQRGPIATRIDTLKENVNGVASGRYSMKVYEVKEAYSIKLASHLRLIDAWKRLSASRGYRDTTFLWDDPWVDFTSRVSPAADGDTVFVEMKAFYYQIGSGANSSWLPQSPGTQRKFNFSLHLENKNAVPTTEIANKEYPIKIYPNPTTGVLSLAFQGVPLVKPLQATFFDITGRLVHKEELKNTEQSVFTLNIQSLAQGTYLLRLDGMDTPPSYYKIVKL
ncbi:MAG: hypothetical protein RIS64_3891 [Bacteroidota bacterium]